LEKATLLIPGKPDPSSNLKKTSGISIILGSVSVLINQTQPEGLGLFLPSAALSVAYVE
jgi:hypothetical protein